PSIAPSLLRRLGRFAYRRHWPVIGVWVAAIVVLIGLSGATGNGYSDSFGDFESEATRGFELLEQFGESAGENQGSLVVLAPEGQTLAEPGLAAAATDLFDSTEAIDGFGQLVVTDLQVAPPGSDLGERLGFVFVQLSGDLNFSDGQKVAEEIRELIPTAEASGLEVYLGGQVFAGFETPESEALGLGFAVVILILAFGSVLAMGLPIGVALAGIGAGIAIVTMVSNLIPMPEFTSIIGIMLGLGVGIDYALFIVTRFREDLHKGMDPEEAAGHALDTAGRAVILAGTTVVISVLGMMVMGLSFIRGIAVGSAIAVVATLLASITLLPALLGLAGDRLEVTRRRGLLAAGFLALALVAQGLGVETVPLVAFGAAVIAFVAGSVLPWLRTPLAPRKQKDPRQSGWYRYSRFVQHRAWLAALGGFAILAVLALPVFGLRLGFSDEGNLAEDTDARQAYDLLAEGFGPGSNGPLIIVTEVPAGTDPAALDAVTATLQSQPGRIAFALPPELNADGTVARWIALPTTAPQSSETADLVRDLRGPVLDEATAGTGLDVLVTSFTAMSVDFSDYLGGRYLPFFVVVLGLSFLLLMTVFRSVLVPLKAVLVNLLSIGAAYGVVVAIFQWGWGASLLGLSSSGAPIEPFMPMMLFAIVFGLSMDYEVFLLSRMKEEYDRTGDNANAVADGLAVTARVITAAALIMVVVFGSFILEDDRVVKLMGTGLAIAVLLDATIVRMLLVPATMELLGDRNWWLPKWLDRILPTIHVEGGPEDLGSDDAPDAPDDPDELDEPERELVGV
ncbi:MAG: MMPL family transporter, partial [Acidimicrobiia bacterium]|nr:MMPL family transporter [Acidimicrobiia bacterium]